MATRALTFSTPTLRALSMIWLKSSVQKKIKEISAGLRLTLSQQLTSQTERVAHRHVSASLCRVLWTSDLSGSHRYLQTEILSVPQTFCCDSFFMCWNVTRRTNVLLFIITMLLQNYWTMYVSIKNKFNNIIIWSTTCFCSG